MKKLSIVFILSAFLMLLNVLAPVEQGYINDSDGGFTINSDLPYID